MSGAERLYTPEMLGWAVRLAEFPLGDDLPLRGDARSPSCGSTLTIGLTLNPQGHIEHLGMRVAACAVGQASAAIFARAATGLGRGDIANTYDELQLWLAGEGALPEWPGLGVIAAARDFPGRHGAILLPWKAALAALPKEGSTV